MNLNELTIKDIGGPIQLMDIGASGELDRKWSPLLGMLDLTAFDPNAEECERLSAIESEFHGKTYLPYAIGGDNESREIIKTKSIYCWSLLEPNQEWLKRFSFADLFSVIGGEQISVRTLDTLDEIASVEFDALKMDTQGMELPILRGASQVMENVFYLETETGFTENYRNETLFHELAAFLAEQDFIMFDINPDHRVARQGPLASSQTRGQPLWCEAVWLRDIIAQHQKGRMPKIERPKALKMLLLCAFEGFFDYGLELANFFHHELKLISAEELAGLSTQDAWVLDKWERKPGYKELSKQYAKVEQELALMKGSRRWRLCNAVFKIFGKA